VLSAGRAKMSLEDAFRLYNVPAPYWGYVLQDCTPEALLPIQNYLQHQKDFVSKGVGLWFSGFAGAGKTAAAVQLVKSGIEGWYGHPTDLTVYFTRASQLRDDIRFHRTFSDCELVEDFVYRAKTLIVDDIDLADFTDPYFNWKSLILRRAGACRPTFFTSFLTFADLCGIQPIWHEQLCQALYEVPMPTANRRAAEFERTRAQLFQARGPA
jgi:DNA replication protein DnaC